MATTATDVLPYFTTPAGDLAETSRGNLCCLGTDGVWRTPPEDENVLPGITRRDLLQAWTDLGRPFVDRPPRGRRQLRAATAVVSTSSISGVVIVDRIDDHRLRGAGGSGGAGGGAQPAPGVRLSAVGERATSPAGAA